MSKSLKPYEAGCSSGDVLRDESGKLYLFHKSARHSADQSETVLLFDLSSKEGRDLAYPLAQFEAELTIIGNVLRPLDIPVRPLGRHQEGTWFRHSDGGHYRFARCVNRVDTGEELVIYDHVWPFEESTWARPAQEFLSKFTQISAQELSAAMSEDRAAAQARISAKRLARKGAPPASAAVAA